MPGSKRTQASDSARRNSGDGVSREADAPQITVRLATAEDIYAFFGYKPRPTIRAMVAELDGQIAGVIGVSREHGAGKFFADFKPELQPYLKSVTIMRAVKKALRFCDAYGGPVLAVAEHGEGCRILHRLGFEHVEGAYYAWPN